MVALALGEMLHPPRKRSNRSAVYQMLEQLETVGAKLINDGISAGTFR